MAEGYFNSDDLYGDESIFVEELDMRILKALVSDHDVMREFSSCYDSNLFKDDAVSFALHVLKYYRRYGSPPTQRVMLDEAGEHNLKISQTWAHLDGMEYVASEFKYDLEQIKQRYTKTQVLSVKDAVDGLDLGNANYDIVLRDMRSKIDAAEQMMRGKEESYTQKTLQEYLPEFKDEYVLKSQDAELGQGIMTGYSYLDYVLNGLAPSDMLVVGAETGGGKSMFLNNLAVQMWMQKNTITTDKDKHTRGYNIQYFSLEMPYKQCARRTLARMGKISSYALRDCQISTIQLKRLSNCARFINEFGSSFEIVDIPRGVTCEDIEERYLEAVARGRRPDVVVVDYVGLMDDRDAAGDDWLKLGYISGKLHEFARAYDVVVCTAVQLNRPKGGQPHDIIGLHRIGRSSLIMHHATVGIQIETRHDESGFDDMIYHIIKNRNGECGKHLLRKDFSCATLVDYEPYKPKISNSEFGSVNLINEDISVQLEKLGWPK